MAKYAKWIGGTLGWVLGGGPIGAILGFALGSVYDNIQDKQDQYRKIPGRDFDISLLVLAAAVMKADQRIVKSELEVVKKFFIENFGVEHTRERMLLLREIVKQDIPLADVCREIQQHFDYHGRLQLLHFLFGIARADGNIEENELRVIYEIASHLSINAADFSSIKAMFMDGRSRDHYYQILEISPDATDDEVKKAYRKMAVKYHPDKVGHLGEEVQEAAKEKFQKVQEAYDRIKQQRGIN